MSLAVFRLLTSRTGWVFVLSVAATCGFGAEPAARLCQTGLFVTPAQLERARGRATDPAWQDRAQRLRTRALALRGLVPNPYTGPSPVEYLTASKRDIMAAMSLALYSTMSDGAERKEIGEKAAEILLAWARNTARDEQFAAARGLAKAENRSDYTGQGLTIGLVALGAAHAYHLLACHGFLNADEQELVRDWLRRMADPILEGRKRWETNGYFGEQEANNHLSIHNAAIYAIGVAADDPKLRGWATSDPANRRNFRRMLTMVIFDGKEAATDRRDDVGSIPQRGEVYDRYRMKSRDLGLHYAFYHLLALTLHAEAAANQGENLYRARGENGESLLDVLLYYGEFLARAKCSLDNPPVVSAGPPNFEYYAGAKIAARYWTWVQPVIARFYDQPRVKELSRKLAGTACSVSPNQYVPVPIEPLVQSPR